MPDYIHRSIRFPATLYQALQALAKAHGWSVTAEILAGLWAHVGRTDPGE